MTAFPRGKPYLDMPLGGFLDAIAAREPAPGGGAACAVTVGVAAALAAMAARFSTAQLSRADSLAAEAEQLRAEVAPLAQQDGAAYADVLAALALARDDPGRTDAVRRALSAAADVPLRIAEIGARVVGLAERLSADGNPHLRGDAVTARLLASAAVRSAATLVEIDLGDVSAADARLARARALVDEVGRAQA